MARTGSFQVGNLTDVKMSAACYVTESFDLCDVSTGGFKLEQLGLPSLAATYLLPYIQNLYFRFTARIGLTIWSAYFLKSL
jgi:hypothetical protein